MSRDSLNHFDHETNARNHPKFKALRVTYGWEGVGRFWALNEMIGGSTEAKLDLTKKVFRATAADELTLSIAEFDAFIAFLADPNECGLVKFKDGILTTDKTQENWKSLQLYREKDKARKVKKQIPTENDRIPTETGSIPTENSDFPSETGPSSVKLSSVKYSNKNLPQDGETPPVDNEDNFFEPEEPEFDPSPPAEPEFDPKPLPKLAIPKSLKFSAKELLELRTAAGDLVQELLDTYSRKKLQHGYRYANDWAAIKDFTAKAGGIRQWLDQANGKATSEPTQGRVIPDARETRDLLAERFTGERINLEELETLLVRPVRSG
jgi:hypothetical protein